MVGASGATARYEAIVVDRGGRRVTAGCQGSSWPARLQRRCLRFTIMGGPASVRAPDGRWVRLLKLPMQEGRQQLCGPWRSGTLFPG